MELFVVGLVVLSFGICVGWSLAAVGLANQRDKYDRVLRDPEFYEEQRLALWEKSSDENFGGFLPANDWISEEEDRVM